MRSVATRHYTGRKSYGVASIGFVTPKPAAEKPKGERSPETPIQKGRLTMRKRNFNINVRVTENEKKRLKRAAKHYGISLSEYLRKVGLRKNLTEKPSQKLYEVYASEKQAATSPITLIRVLKQARLRRSFAPNII